MRPSSARSRITLQHLAHEFGIERGGRLVEQHHLRLHAERARDGRALLLAAGQEGRIVVALVVEADLVEQPLGALDRLRLRHAEHMHRRLDDVLQHRHVLPEIEALEHHAEPGADALELAAVGGVEVAVLVAG